MGMKIYDISLSLHNQTIIYPGNPGIFIEPRRAVPEYPTNLSKITFGSHTGTHVDAPRHVDNNAIGVDKIDLEKCIGPCRVLDFMDCEEKISVLDLEKQSVKSGERILAKTKNSLRLASFDSAQDKSLARGKPPHDFFDDAIYLDGDAADLLANKGIILFGIDWLSIKKRGGEDTRPHTSFLSKNIVIFEGLDLSKVEPGKYEFIGLPLKFTDLDGAPARAVLVKE